jgi:hypothetical protein
MAGAIEDILAEAGMSEEKEEKPEDKNAQQYTDLSKQIDDMRTQVQQTQSQLSQASKDREELISRQAKMIGYIEGTGVGKYDPNTGDIIKIEPQVDESKEIEKEIKELEKDLKVKLDNGDIEHADYWRLLQEQRAPLKDRLDELKFDRRVKTFEDKVTKSVKTDPKADPVVVTNTESYNKVAVDFPDVNNTSSELFKEMARLYDKYPNKYAKANYDGGKGDPRQYRDLAERAVEILEAKGVATNKQVRTHGQFNSPSNDGYERKAPAKSNISKSDVGLLVGQGYSNANLLKQVNSIMADYETNGGVTTIKEY